MQLMLAKESVKPACGDVAPSSGVSFSERPTKSLIPSKCLILSDIYRQTAMC